MKKILLKLAFFAVIATLIFATIGCDLFNKYRGVDTRATKGLEYTLNEDGKSYSVTGLGEAENETRIVIAYKYEGKPVTAIGKEAFKNCDKLTDVEIPDGVTSIGDSAFAFCDELSDIVIPSRVTSIGAETFYSCDKLTNVEISNGVTSIGYGAFAFCDELSEIEIPSSVTSIGDNAFEHCDKLTNVEIPDGVTSIGASAFMLCENLTCVKIPSSVTSIGFFAFAGCPAVTSITVDKDNKKYHSADNCIIETESKTLISGCKTSVIPTDGSVTSIGDYAFMACVELTSIEIPNGVTNVGNGAFAFCVALTSIEIPNSITSIGERFLGNGDELTEINFRGTVDEWKAIEKADYWDNWLNSYTVHCTDGDLDKSGIRIPPTPVEK